jgi:cytochrome c oxidase subunit 2
VMFYRGMKGMVDLVTPPGGAYQIDVSAQRWQWLFQYPNGHVDPDLHVPLDVPVLLVMRSEDVIHSFYVPAFRIKQDVVPGRRTKTWFRATKPGDYLLFCAEYCGTGHSDMTARVVVHPAGEYRQWLENAARLEAQLSPVEAGRRLYRIRACAQCHSVDGRGGIGPTFKDLFGHRQKLTDGSEVLVDENYIRESILEPGAKIVAGYDAVMPTYQGRITEDDITSIIHYLKSLSESKETTSQPGG